MPLLGVVLADSSYQLGRKALAKLVGAGLPGTLKELQGLAGKLNFVGQFVPDYKRLVKPILQLLSSSSPGVWTQEHTAALNRIAELVYRRLQIGLVDMTLGAKVYVDVDDVDCCAVMVQQGPNGDTKVNAIMGRELTKSE